MTLIVDIRYVRLDHFFHSTKESRLLSKNILSAQVYGDLVNLNTVGCLTMKGGIRFP